jgi:hypothetical protein
MGPVAYAQVKPNPGPKEVNTLLYVPTSPCLFAISPLTLTVVTPTSTGKFITSVPTPSFCRFGKYTKN